MNHNPQRRVDRQSHGVYRAVSHVDELDLETAQADFSSGADFVQRGLVLEVVLFQPPLDHRLGVAGAVDRRIELRKDVGDGPDVVLVAMRENQAPDVLAVVDQVGEVGDDDVDAEQLAARKHQPRVDDDNIVSAAQSQHVHAELAKPA